MDNSKDLFKELSQRYSPEELVESFVFPHDLSKEEKQNADAELWAWRKKRRENMSPKERIYAGLLRLKYQLKKYLEQEAYNEEKGVSFFLLDYMMVVQRKQKQLAEDIGIHPTRLSRILNKKEKLSLSLAYRLEVHAGEILPAIYWWKLVQREIEQEIRMDEDALNREKKKVKRVGYNRAS